MHDDCCAVPEADAGARDPLATARYRRVLWAALILNAGMFLGEIVAGWVAGSAALQADALDFFGDAANYGVSLFVAGMALRWRATAALAKGTTMGLFGAWVLGTAAWHALAGSVPEAPVMGAVGVAALAVNLACLGLLFAFRTGDLNMRSVWICTRNDVIGNFAVLAAAAGVLGTGSGWPDIAVAAIMATLALAGARKIIRQAQGELAQAGLVTARL